MLATVTEESRSPEVRRRYKRRRSSTALVCVGATVVLLVARAFLFPSTSPIHEVARLTEGVYQVDDIEADARIVLRHSNDANKADSSFRIALLGIEPNRTPEISAYLKTAISDRSVALRLDRTRIDQDGQMVGYVYIDDQLVNAEIVRIGMAKARCRPGDSGPIKRILKKAEQEAKGAMRGVWAEAH